MSRLGGLLVCSAVFASLPTSAIAQRCLGAAAFADGGLRGAATVSHVGKEHSNGVELSVGRDRGLFASGDVTHSWYKGASLSSTKYGGSVGYQVRLGSRVHVCPTLDVSATNASWNVGGTHLDYGNTTLGVSAAIAAVAWSSPRFDVVPAARLSYFTYAARAQSARLGIERESTGSGRLGSLGLSTGLIFRKVITVQPFMAIPLGYTGGATTYGVSFGISFGPKH